MGLICGRIYLLTQVTRSEGEKRIAELTVGRNHKGTKAAWISVIANVVLTILKLLVGTFAVSQALLADGIHSAADVVASIAVLVSMIVAGRPADDEHPYGHGKAEVVASLLVAGILVGAAFEIGISAVKSLWEPASRPEIISLGTAAFSLLLKQTLYVYRHRLGVRLRSQALLATAIDHQADVVASAAAVVGIGVAVIGIYMHKPLLYYGDPLAGILVAVLILRLAYTTGREAIDTLMERNVKQDFLNQLEICIWKVAGVERIDRLRARDLGHYIVVDIRVAVEGDKSIKEGHDIAKEIRHGIMQTHAEVQEVLIHINPWYKEEGG